VKFEERKNKAAAWFKRLRDDICAEFEALERDAPNDFYPGERGKFVFEPWERKVENGGGGTGGMLRGRFFEKCGVHISVVKGEFEGEMRERVLGAKFEGEMRERVLGAKDDPRFWATGISLIAHMHNPHVPCVHFNTRYIVTTQDWFGGGGDLTPTQAKDRAPTQAKDRVQTSPDAIAFHAGMKAACDAHDIADYEAFKKGCDDYFHLHHRDEARGVGGIFYDRFNSGRYVEFNLLWDRGTTFGLKTGGNIKTILSSMPPVVKWP